MPEVDLDLGPRLEAQRARADLAGPNAYSSSVEKTPRRPVWRRAIPSSSRSSSNGSIRTFESEPMQSGIPRVATRSAGRKPSPRSASVVGHAQIVAPWRRGDRARHRSACVACTIVVRSVRQPVRRGARSAGSRARRGTPRSPSAARRRGCAAAAPRGGVAPDLLEPVGRAGAHGVGGDSDGDARRRAALDLLEILAHRVLAEAVEAAARVGDVEEDERDPGRAAASAAARASAAPR